MTLAPHSKAILALEAGFVVCWSSGFIGSELASQTRSIYLVLFWRFSAVVAVLLPFCARQIAGMERREIGLHLVLGTFAMFGCLVSLVTAVDMGVPAGTAALITSLQPLATAALAGPVLRETVLGRQWFGLVVGLCGVFLAIGGGLGSAPFVAFALALAGTVSITVATLIGQAKPSKSAFLPALTVQSLATAILLLPLAAKDGFWPEASSGFLMAMVWFILLSTIGAYGFYWTCLARTSATRVSSLMYLTPPVTGVWAFVMFGQPVEATSVIGFAVCLAGVVMASRRVPNTRSPAQT